MVSSPTQPSPLRHAAVALLVAALAVGCASGKGGDGDPDTGPPPPDATPSDASGMDAGPRDTGPPPGDGGPVDTGPEDTGPPDTGPPPCDPPCTGFERCVSMECTPYPACGAGDACPATIPVCSNGFCVEADADPDGDGSPASEDCDETDPLVFPGQTEGCNMVDDDCDATVDEGDPAALCEALEQPGICIEGACGCPDGSYDFDPAVPGCECTASPALTAGAACAAPIDLGDISDTGGTVAARGNLPEAGREVWFRFRGVDVPETAAENYYVDVRFTENPDDAFEMDVYRGGCGTADFEGITNYSWAADFRATIDGRLTGHSPCHAGSFATAPANVSICADFSAEYFVLVRRRPASTTVSCAEFALELTNGVYDTP